MGSHGDGVVSAAASQHEDHSSCQTLQLLGSNRGVRCLAQRHFRLFMEGFKPESLGYKSRSYPKCV